MEIFSELTLLSGIFLFIALFLALAFEFVNGFHDTANAVATVIYTHALKPNIAVVWSGVWNLLGVLASSGAVAYSIVALLPVELVINAGSEAGLVMVFSLLISAIIWNLGTWSLGLPASSSHTLIDSIMGVGLANSIFTPGAVFGEGVNWGKVSEVFASLMISPLVGFGASALLLIVGKLLIRNPELFKAPEGKTAPPLWIRGLLILTCTGVSFAHGSNDGQKGMGLIMLILVGIVPGLFALNMNADAATLEQLVSSSGEVVMIVNSKSAQPGLALGLSPEASRHELSGFLKTTGKFNQTTTFPAISKISSSIADRLKDKSSFAQIAKTEREDLRTDMYLVSGAINKLNKQHKLPVGNVQDKLVDCQKLMDGATKYIPTWVKVAVALALGLGTMIGWEKIVVTVGEKIGKDHLTYGQGASAELVAAATIFAADNLGLPVSTTHVLSSGVAGTMAPNGSGLQGDTVRNILLAWILTLPICVLLGSVLFSAGLFITSKLTTQRLG